MSVDPVMNQDPHREIPVHSFGASLADARGAVILLHGRGATAQDILTLAVELDLPQLAYLAPQAAGNSWYPNSFLVPRPQNEPWLTSALAKVHSIVQALHGSGFGNSRIVVAGFSQGACLATEFVATYPARYAGLIAFTGGLVGPIGEDLMHQGDLAGTPALFQSGDPDPHVPWARVQQSAEVLKKMGAAVETKRYPGRSHIVSSEEIDYARELLRNAFVRPNK